MNYFDLNSSYPDHTITAAWESQLKEAGRTPWLTDTLSESGCELFPRFAACYSELRALRRGARRSLQRQLAHSSELAAVLPDCLQRQGRRLQHRMAWSLAGAALLLALSQGIATAATITVTTNNPNIVADGHCSLIEAIINANNDGATHADCAAGNGADTIVLPVNGSITFSNAHEAIYSTPTALPLIASLITIQGNGATIARNGNAPPFRLMVVSNTGDLMLQNVILSGGASDFRGAGISNAGNLTIQTSIVSGNVGVGVSNWGTLTIENSTISNNTASAWGGGLYNGTVVNIVNSTISGNSAGTSGGGVYNWGNIIIENSTISGNSAVWGGGLLNTGALTISNSTISDNIATGAGGLLNTYYCYFGCSFGYLTLNNSLVAGNQASVAPEIQNYSTINVNNFNLLGANGNAGVAGFSPGPTDIVPIASVGQILGPLQDNGGPTDTHALVAGSVAIEAGNPAGCQDNSGALLFTDQRGLARRVDGNIDGTIRCDIGAYELGAEFVPVPIFTTLKISNGGTGSGTVTSNPTGINCGGDCAQNYNLDTVVTLVATAALDSVFAGFSGNVDCLDGVVTMNVNKTCVATFTRRPTLWVNKAGTGSGIVISNPLGINCGGDCSENYDVGAVVVINPNPDATSVFSGWSGDPDCVDGVVTMNANKTCTANFSKRFSLTVNKAGTGSGIVTSNLQGINCGGDCSENYDPGVVVTLIANPDAVSVFSGWTGDPDCADETVTMNANKTCIANFNASLISLAIGATTLATGEAGVSFTSDLMISGGVAPYGVSIDRGKLPAGLSLENNGIISGTLSPTARSEKITVRITDSVKQSISKTFTIIVLKTLRIVDKPKVGRVGNNYTDSLKTKGGRGPFSWSIASGALPSGLNFNTTTGAITGIPTQAGEFLLTVQVTDALGGIDVETLALKIK